MNTQTTHPTLLTLIVSVAVVFIALVPTSAFAEVVPLAPLPTNFGNNNDSLGGYLNTIFYTIIAAAAILAVLRIVWGGFQYMTSEAVTQTKDARVIITMAIVGLILLLASWLILYVINPSLTRLDALDFDFTPLENVSGQTEFALGGEETLTQTQIDEALQDNTFVQSRNPVSGDVSRSETDVTGASSRDLANLSQACAAKGNSYSSEVLVQRTCVANSSGKRYGQQVQAGEEYKTDYSSEQLLFGSDANLSARCNPGDDPVSKQKVFACQTSI